MEIFKIVSTASVITMFIFGVSVWIGDFILSITGVRDTYFYAWLVSTMGFSTCFSILLFVHWLGDEEEKEGKDEET